MEIAEAAIEHAANLGHLFAQVLATVSVVHGGSVSRAQSSERSWLATKCRFSSLPTGPKSSGRDWLAPIAQT
jgi:hypothetical protein